MKRMIRYVQAVTASLFFTVVAGVPIVAGRDAVAVTTPHPISDGDLAGAVSAHQKWVQDRDRAWLDKLQGKPFAIVSDEDPRRARLLGLVLSNTDFSGGSLDDAIFDGSLLSQASFNGARLIRASFQQANLLDAKLRRANARYANFRGASLVGTDLTDALLLEANLSRTRLSYVNLEGANLNGAIVSKATFRLTPEMQLDARQWINVRGLSEIHFYDHSTRTAFLRLRDEFRRTGPREQDRALTAALWRDDADYTSGPEQAFRYVFLDLPSEYGYAPERALRALFAIFVLCSLPYGWVVWRGSASGVSGIWRVWHPDRIRASKAPGFSRAKPRRTAITSTDAPSRLNGGFFKALWYGAYFSLLSAFHFGWRDLNVGSWIARVQVNEYSLRPTGWVRSVSGLQSLVSLYLLATAALTYFSRPFE